jgi:hypothetical protein
MAMMIAGRLVALLRSLGRIVLLLLALPLIFFVLCIPPWVYSKYLQTNLDERLPPPGRVVDIGTHRLHINCTGQGSPTVVLD